MHLKARALATNLDGWGASSTPSGGSSAGWLLRRVEPAPWQSAMCLTAGQDRDFTVADAEPANGCGQFIADIEKAKVHSGNPISG
jgi:hypothetical protein